VAINHNIINAKPSCSDCDSGSELEKVPSGKLCWCPACRKESLRYRDYILNKGKSSSPAKTSNTVVFDKKWDIDSLLGILDETRFMMMNRAVDPDAVYAHGELNSVFPLLSNIVFTDLKQLSPSTGVSSGSYNSSDIFSAISGNKNIKE
jgi:hypothetical protein